MKRIFIVVLLLWGCSKPIEPVPEEPDNDWNDLAKTASCLTNTVSVNLLTGSCGAIPVNLPGLLNGINYISVTDPGQGSYATFVYSDSNGMPASHRHVGDSLAVLVQPIAGKIKVIAEGMSNARDIFNAFATKLSQSILDNPNLQFVNNSQGGCDLTCWVAGGVGTIDNAVQVVLLYHSNNRPQTVACEDSKRFPTHAMATQGQLETRLNQLRQKYPSLKQIYITSREFGGWGCPPSGSRYSESVAFEEGFSVKWFVAGHLTQAQPFVAWGPYTWDKTTPRSYFRSDGVHPCAAGQDVFSQQWFDFLLNNSTSRPWFAANP